MDPALRAFAVTNLDKDPATGGWAWRINIDAIQSSMGTLAQFDSGKRHQEEIQGRLVGGSGDRIGDDKDELGSYKGDVSAGSGAALGSYECGFWSTRIAPQGDCLHFSVGLPPVLTALIPVVLISLVFWSWVGDHQQWQSGFLFTMMSEVLGNVEIITGMWKWCGTRQ